MQFPPIIESFSESRKLSDIYTICCMKKLEGKDSIFIRKIKKNPEISFRKFRVGI